VNPPGLLGRIIPFLFILVSGALVCVEHGLARPGSAYQDLPPSIDPSRKYLFYMHGRIVELRGRNAASKEHGRYQYDDIVKALADRGFVVISEVRPANTTVEYGRKVAGRVRALMAAGVAPSNIAVTGFSKGGFLTIVTAAVLGEPKVNFVIMAGCGIGPYEQILREFAPQMKGRVLSLYDRADREAASCREAFRRAPGLEHKEVELVTGVGHGLFYAPRREWLDPVSDWATAGR
jgi:dienelactone hydrolase